jgi:glucose/arabinose dehydrogenase
VRCVVGRCLTCAAIAAILLAAGCGGSDDEPTASTTSTTSTTTAEKPPRDERAPQVGDGEGGVRLEELGEFEQPVYVTQPPSGDKRLFVVEQCGRIVGVDSDGETQTFLDVSELITCGGEQGLLSAAFAPDYERSGRFYVNYTATDGTSRTVEYRRSDDDPNVADPDSARELLQIEDFASNHNGGLLLFGPDDDLYLGMGDGGGGGDPERTAQDPSSLLGKLIRVDTGAGGSESQLAALGLRNPWRFSFDRETDDLWIGDVGQDALEEIDAVTFDQFKGPDAPLNFGWSAYEGTERFNSDQEAPGAIEPVLVYGREGGCSVTGGYVVRDPELRSLYGRYLYGDYCEGQLRSFTARPGAEAGDDVALGVQIPSLSSFGEDATGHVYATSLEGPVYRLAPD